MIFLTDMIPTKLKKHINLARVYLKTLGFFHGVRRIFFEFFYRRLTDSTEADYAYKKSSYKFLAKYYQKHSISFDFAHPDNEIKQNELIYWTCWLQGMENAPPMVRSCYNSAQRHSDGHRIIVITYENLDTYVTLPDFIMEKHKKGYITATHLSDILRLYLLYTYGDI
jgi:hypothetical protein